MPNGTRLKILERKLLIVEGKDEENFFTAALTNYLNIGDIQVLPIGGKTLLTGSLSALKNDPAFSAVQAVAIIRDADSTPAGSSTTAAQSAFLSVSSSLSAANVQLPLPHSHGQFAAGPPKVGIYIMPDGVSDGMLESLCVSSVAGQPEFSCVTDLFQCVQRYVAIPNNIHKAKAHAWLSTRAEPDKRVGEAALAGYWPFADPVYQNLWLFLKQL